MSAIRPRLPPAAGLVPVSALILLLSAFGGRAGDQVTVSQKDKQFTPGSVSLAKGQSLDIVNDDGTTVHHAYVESDNFNFDSGDQLPGKRVVIAFPGSGRFTVLCGIHPKMKLDVVVR